MNDVSPQFKVAVQSAMVAVNQVPDDAIQYMLHGWGNPGEVVPVYLLPKAQEDQAAAAGCTTCTFLGLWAKAWPGYPMAPHGMVWLFEDGIKHLPPDLPVLPNERPAINAIIENLRSTQSPLTAYAFSVMVHEFQHALERDHVLDAMEAAKGKGQSGQRLETAAMTTRGCGCPGSSARR